MTRAFEIRPIAETDIAGFHAVIDAVARERRYLAMLTAPPVKSCAEFVRNNIRLGRPQCVALAGGRVVGWCDITPMERETQAHGGVLGMGILEDFRGKGIGLALIHATLERARSFGLTRIELTVRDDNTRARTLYEKVGFKAEGVKRKAALHDGKYHDLLLMALLFEP